MIAAIMRELTGSCLLSRQNRFTPKCSDKKLSAWDGVGAEKLADCVLKTPEISLYKLRFRSAGKIVDILHISDLACVK